MLMLRPREPRNLTLKTFKLEIDPIVRIDRPHDIARNFTDLLAGRLDMLLHPIPLHHRPQGA
ncbi:hypothetical protein DZK27_08405 [Rhodobacteraceae bacterium 63075]|nr:hypothetical protein DZK27_08405 [Rhodobacteraceae bacterium 63075]